MFKAVACDSLLSRAKYFNVITFSKVILIRVYKLNIESIWSEYRSSIKSFLHSKVSNTTEVDDLLQEVLIKSYDNLHSINKESSIKAWLFTIANNTIIDFYRKNDRYRDLEEDDLWYTEGDINIKQELTQCVEPFLDALPEDSARLLRVIDLEGKSQKEHAKDLGISYSTLKSRVQKGRVQLRKLFDECCHFELDRFGNLTEFNKKSNSCKKC